MLSYSNTHSIEEVLSKEIILASNSDMNSYAIKKKNEQERLFTRSQILIAPGYTFKIADAIVTNFHQPQSTLLLLVAAATGNDWNKIYDHAMQNDFRFLSYGDGGLLFINK